jgi:hypothetical protein
MLGLDRATSSDVVGELPERFDSESGWNAVKHDFKHAQLHRTCGNRTMRAMQIATEQTERQNPRGNRFINKPSSTPPSMKMRLLPREMQRGIQHLAVLPNMLASVSMQPDRLTGGTERTTERGSIRVTIGSEMGQHTVVWEKPFTTELPDGKQVTLRPGSCALNVSVCPCSEAHSRPQLTASPLLLQAYTRECHT